MILKEFLRLKKVQMISKYLAQFIIVMSVLSTLATFMVPRAYIPYILIFQVILIISAIILLIYTRKQYKKAKSNYERLLKK